MKLVTKNIHYAIKSLLYFAKDSTRVVSVNELVKKLNMRRAFLRRILQALSKYGVLKSLKGYNGGFMLNRKPDKIRIIDIVSIFHDETDIIGCLSEKDVCPQPDKCLLMQKMKEIEFQFNSTLRLLTVAKLLKSIGRQVRKD
ncbi:MAG: Rrf2 family transcriptional regulator [Candidatus Omnitrophica bacterium]|nr:Rrf2 family transcriptional regulator [Candidatus Omnitrophota bacterium]MDD5352038.1 Rrf2 family transcriptional regulator [Candidatus Omnitrophota bacterium]MDD5551178.1 Rrf2 family transcriptional regulator [Candidatus Omnitrophota bacterium]